MDRDENKKNQTQKNQWITPQAQAPKPRQCKHTPNKHCYQGNGGTGCGNQEKKAKQARCKRQPQVNRPVPPRRERIDLIGTR